MVCLNAYNICDINQSFMYKDTIFGSVFSLGTDSQDSPDHRAQNIS